ncbi:hypothetical protein [Geodermatophilus sabuli]|uniref:Thioredoxin n=1 Tax=Geodermatophilus sabuli TaxID=1564158 RepID=A0A285EJ36_9ACTN|nr:hypothetical protein [Geodermatophilus sabuli]MBB3083711.1 hypothetical protein [Geodermatophilus sabuli]SNX99142.1 hypothetical protein SAMN06893097_11515 [Geodermatophilus sabuli]
MNPTQRAIEHCYAEGWTDGLPVVPCDRAAAEALLARVDRDPDEVLLEMPQLNRAVTVRLAAVNAVMAGCLPEYFPVVVAAWDSLREEGYPRKGIWQSTTGTASLLLVNGPVRGELGVNSQGNLFGPGFRANATIGRAVRLTAMNALGLRPHELDQATQGTPAKYTACIGENEEESPWQPLHVDHGLAPEDSAVTAMTMRSTLHIEARHTRVPEQLLDDVAGSLARTGALLHQTVSACVVLCPEHAHLLADAGWAKRDVSRYLYEQSFLPREALDRAGKGAVSAKSHWRVARDHPDAVLDPGPDPARDGIHTMTSPDAVLVVVAGASNSGVSAVVETFGPRGNRPAVTRVAA